MSSKLDGQEIEDATDVPNEATLRIKRSATVKLPLRKTSANATHQSDHGEPVAQIQTSGRDLTPPNPQADGNEPSD